jgi:hypothetical protein
VQKWYPKMNLDYTAVRYIQCSSWAGFTVYKYPINPFSCVFLEVEVIKPTRRICYHIWGYHPNPYDCAGFIQCFWGIPIPMPCPRGTIWSQQSLTCVIGTCSKQVMLVVITKLEQPCYIVAIIKKERKLYVQIYINNKMYFDFFFRNVEPI